MAPLTASASASSSHASLLLCYGLWAHDWTTIVASVGVAVIWPAIENDVRMRQQQTLLDRLWDDDDLSDSA